MELFYFYKIKWQQQENYNLWIIIPNYQKSNQRVINLKEILQDLPYIDKESSQYSFIRSLNKKYLKIELLNGVHARDGDSLHFNIRVHNKQTRPHTIIYQTCHVYVMPMVVVDDRGNPRLDWIIDPIRQITCY